MGFIHGLIPVFNDGGVYAGVILVDFALPRVISLAVRLVAPHDGALNRGCGKCDVVAFGGEVGAGDAEFALFTQ